MKTNQHHTLHRKKTHRDTNNLNLDQMCHNTAGNALLSFKLSLTLLYKVLVWMHRGKSIKKKQIFEFFEGNMSCTCLSQTRCNDSRVLWVFAMALLGLYLLALWPKSKESTHKYDILVSKAWGPSFSVNI